MGRDGRLVCATSESAKDIKTPRQGEGSTSKTGRFLAHPRDETRGAENVGSGSDAHTDAHLRGETSESARSPLRGHLVWTDRVAKQEAANNRP